MEFKLYWDNQAVPIKLKEIVTPRMRGEGVDILAKMEELDPKLKLRRKMLEVALDARDRLPESDGKSDDQLYKEAVEKGIIPKETIKELATFSIESETIKPAIEKELDLLKIEIFKLLIDYKSVPAQIKEHLQMADFWLEQDLEGMAEAINSFLVKTKLNVAGNIKI